MQIKSGGSRRPRLKLAYVLLLSLVFVVVAPIHSAVYATTMTKTSVVETNMNTSGASGLFVNFKTGAADSASTLTITFPVSGFTLTAQTPSTTTCAAYFGGGATALPSSSTLGSSVASNVYTITNVSTSLVSGTDYCFALPATAVTNPSGAGNYNTIIADGTDTQTQGIDIIANDQIAVSAQISQFFTLSFGSNTDSITNIAPSNYATSGGVTLTVSTNAASGWGLWAKDANGGLHSTTASKTINSVGSATNFNGATIGTEAYGVNVTAVTGTAAATTNYNGTTNAYAGGPISSTVWNEVASASATGSGTAKVGELLDVAPTTPNATDYADTVTIVGDGSF